MVDKDIEEQISLQEYHEHLLSRRQLHVETGRTTPQQTNLEDGAMYEYISPHG